MRPLIFRMTERIIKVVLDTLDTLDTLVTLDSNLMKTFYGNPEIFHISIYLCEVLLNFNIYLKIDILLFVNYSYFSNK